MGTMQRGNSLIDWVMIDGQTAQTLKIGQELSEKILRMPDRIENLSEILPGLRVINRAGDAKTLKRVMKQFFHKEIWARTPVSRAIADFITRDVSEDPALVVRAKEHFSYPDTDNGDFLTWNRYRIFSSASELDFDLFGCGRIEHVQVMILAEDYMGMDVGLTSLPILLYDAYEPPKRTTDLILQGEDQEGEPFVVLLNTVTGFGYIYTETVSMEVLAMMGCLR